LEKYDLLLSPKWLLEENEKLEEQLAPLLFGEEKVTAFVCHNDEVALKCLRILKKKGLRVPEDISLVGYDDSFIAEATDISLTTVAHPKNKMAGLAAEKLMELINRREDWPFTYTYEPRLIIRSSTRKLLP
jgi:GntR family transcriptional regulator of arabinose operon